MTVALIDNGSLEPASTRNLRAVATTLSADVDVAVHPVSWKHSDRIALSPLDGDAPGVTLAPFVRAQVAAGTRRFVFTPFFISAQGAIGSALRTDLEKLQHEHAATPFAFTFTTGLADAGVIAQIVAARVRETISVADLDRPPVLVVDHGGPSPTSAALRNRLADEVRDHLGTDVASVTATSMEGEDHAHNHPILADALATLVAASASPALRESASASRDVVIALLFLSPGRHAGPGGDIAQICGTAESQFPALRCHLTDLVGTHPLAATALAAALRTTLTPPHAPLSA
jgi:sirohydrochlorin ferrochelatase